MTQTIIGQLDQLAELQAQRDALALSKQGLIDAVLTPEIRQALAAIDIEFAPQFDAVDERINALTAEVKGAVLEHGASVKGAHYHAVWSKPRVSWDSKALDGYALNHPELFAFRTEGKPSVSLRKC